MTITLILLALLVGLVAGFIAGRRIPRVDPAQFRRIPRRNETEDRPVDTRRPLADELFGTRTDAPVTTGPVTLAAAHTGDVFVVLARPEGSLPLTNVDVQIVWGAFTGTTTLDRLGAAPVAIKFGKNKASAADAVVTVNTSAATVRSTVLGTAPAGVPTRTLDWK
jgi:hypothetical protein